jgi:hypothetical protein
MANPVLDRLMESYGSPLVGLDSLRPYTVRDILLVASLYDAFTLSEDGQLAEQILGDFHSLALTAPAHVTRVPTAARALKLLRERRFDLVITMTRVGDFSVADFGREVKNIDPQLPVCVMALDSRDLGPLEEPGAKLPGIDRVFLWQGDTRLFLAIAKLVEDALNAEHDARAAGVRTLILVEDSVSFYSSYLPLLYDEFMKQTGALMSEGVNMTQRLLRMRARPKILLATTYEEAEELYEKFRDTLLAVISDLRFPHGGRVDPEAGLGLVRRIRADDPYTPLVLQSSDESVRETAKEVGAAFLHKNSPTLLHEFRAFMMENLGFGDFVFRLPDGTEVGRAADLATMVKLLEEVPAASLEFHGRLNHFSNWLLARTEFSVASALRRRRVSEFDSAEVMRDFLRKTLITYRRQARHGLVEDFDPRRFDASSQFVRIGGGSLGGKGRGLAFAHELLSRHDIEDYFEGLRIFVPPSAVLGTDIFDRFLERNGLLEFALRIEDDRAICERFLSSELPRAVVEDLGALLDLVRYPLAVRSSSLLEDSHHQPFAGIYATLMVPNAAADRQTRLDELLAAIKYIYASTYFRVAKAYLATTPNRMEEEKMAVVIQQVIGRRRDHYVYPHVSGVASSFNYYPVGKMKPEEGIASVALGLGKTVVEGGRAVRFSPALPESLPQFSRTKDILQNAQREFWALDLARSPDFTKPDSNLVQLDLAEAESHGMLSAVGSTYSPEADAVYDGLTRAGVRLVTFAPILKHRLIPLGDVVQLLLEMGYRGMAGPVEIEFAVNLQPDGRQRKEFAFLQIRPTFAAGPPPPADLENVRPEDVFVRAPQALGTGELPEIRDLVIVRRDSFAREHTIEIAAEVGRMNAKLRAADRPYLLLGPGRWGTADRWLGIPVGWPDLSSAKVILECDLEDLKVEPSQGTHFFQNMISYGVGYYTVHESEGGTVDWEWLESLPSEEETRWLRHIRLKEPLQPLVDFRRGAGIILKRGRSPR